MIRISDIEISKSIESGYLIRRRNWINSLERILLAFITIALMVYLTSTFLDIDFHDPKDRNSFLTFFLPLCFLFLTYFLYRILMQNRLTCIETSFGQNKNHELLCVFIKEFQYDILQESKKIIIVNEEDEMSFNGYWSKDIIFLIYERKIYFNILYISPRASRTVLFFHFILKHDLKKYFSKAT